MSPVTIHTVCRGPAVCLLPFLLLFAAPRISSADEIRPGMLEITERDNGWVDVTWKVH